MLLVETETTRSAGEYKSLPTIRKILKKTRYKIESIRMDWHGVHLQCDQLHWVDSCPPSQNLPSPAKSKGGVTLP